MTYRLVTRTSSDVALILLQQPSLKVSLCYNFVSAILRFVSDICASPTLSVLHYIFITSLIYILVECHAILYHNVIRYAKKVSKVQNGNW